MNSRYYIERLWYTGPGIEDSEVKFKDGLNIIHGASDTGKSWILDSFDFMCGLDYDKFVIDKDTGCDTVHIAVRTKNGLVTMHRGLGSTKIEVESTDPEIESHTYTAGNSKYPINRVWMTITGVGEGVKIIKNENGGRQSLTYRSFLNLICVAEGNVIGKDSIFFSKGGPFSKTATKSTLLYFLNENDFQEYKEKKDPKKKTAENKARAAVKIENLAFLSTLKPDEEEDVLSREEAQKAIDDLVQQIREAQDKISETSKKRQEIEDRILEVKDLQKSAKSMKNRYQILLSQYRSDIRRISFIVDGQQKLESVEQPKKCPFCGGDIHPEQRESYEEAAQAELNRILPQLNDVMDAQHDIDSEISGHQAMIDELRAESDKLSNIINQELEPAIQALQDQISGLKLSIDRSARTDVIEKVEKFMTSAKKKEEDPNDAQAPFKAQDNFSEDFVDAFNNLLIEILKEVKFHNYKNCFFDFDSDDFDIVVNGKKKLRWGKGYRAFLNTVVALALHQYLAQSGKHGLGVLLLDSPILSLKEGGDETTDYMRRGLFNYMVAHQDCGQVIIVENSIPKIDYKDTKLEYYTHGEEPGRYGLLIGYTD